MSRSARSRTLKGGGGNAWHFVFSNGKGVTGTVTGGGGTDTLDYSLYTTGVTVNLVTGTATGTGGISSILNVYGGSGNDTSTGNSAGNTIKGNGGQDTLSGGGNATFILGSTQTAGTTVTGTSSRQHAGWRQYRQHLDADRRRRRQPQWHHHLHRHRQPDRRHGHRRLQDQGRRQHHRHHQRRHRRQHAGLPGDANAIAVNLQTDAATGIKGGAAAGFSGITVLVGNPSAADSLTGPNTTNNWTKSSADAANVNSTFTFSGIGTLVGSTGTDNFDLTTASSAEVSIAGGGGTDTLTGANIANTWTLTGEGAGTLNTTAYGNITNLVGGTSTDAFAFHSGSSVAGTINGGTRHNTLDYSGNGGSAIAVNLHTEAATAFKGGAPGGFSNIGVLVGSSAATDTLIGANTANTWTISAADTCTVSTFAFSSIEKLVGGTGTDNFNLTTAASAEVSIAGGGGTEHLTGGNIANTWTLTGTGGHAEHYGFQQHHQPGRGHEHGCLRVPFRRQRCGHHQRRHRREHPVSPATAAALSPSTWRPMRPRRSRPTRPAGLATSAS